MNCPSEQELLDFLEGALPGGPRARIEEHLAECEGCRLLTLAWSQRSDAAPTEPRSGPLAHGPPAFPCAPGDRLGRYAVQRYLAGGAMGDVWAAKDEQLSRPVALKLVRAGALSAPQVRSLLREARAAAVLAHPNVVKVYDLLELGGADVLVMEQVEGTSLRAWLKETPRTPGQVFEVMLGAGRGLAAVHAAGLVHRDFKPDNVLVAPDGTAKVGDFGIAAISQLADPAPSTRLDPTARDSSGSSGELVGTPAYMAPEQLRGERVDARSDQFSFAVVLFEALVGHRPFKGSTVEELRRVVGKASPRLPRALGLPRRWVRALTRALRHDPSGRFPSMQAMLAALEGKGAERRRQAALGLGGAALAVAVALLVRGYDPCPRQGRRVARSFGPAEKEGLRAAFLALPAPYARSAHDEVRRLLDAQADGWVRAQRESCLATRVAGERSVESLRARDACLELRLEELRTLAEQLGRGEAAVLERAVDAALLMPSPVECLQEPAPRQPSAPVSVAEALPRVAALRARLLTGQLDPPDDPHAPSLQSLGRASVEWNRLQARLALARKDPPGARRWLIAAVAEAERAEHPLLVAQAYQELSVVAAVHLASAREGEDWGEHAQAAARRAMPAGETAVFLHGQRAVRLVAVDRWTEAADEWRLAVSAAGRAFGDEDLRTAAARAELAVALRHLERASEATAAGERALSTYRARLGTTHPLTRELSARLEGAPATLRLFSLSPG